MLQQNQIVALNAGFVCLFFFAQQLARHVDTTSIRWYQCRFALLVFSKIVLKKIVKLCCSQVRKSSVIFKADGCVNLTCSAIKSCEKKKQSRLTRELKKMANRLKQTKSKYFFFLVASNAFIILKTDAFANILKYSVMLHSCYHCAYSNSNQIKQKHKTNDISYICKRNINLVVEFVTDSDKKKTTTYFYVIHSHFLFMDQNSTKAYLLNELFVFVFFFCLLPCQTFSIRKILFSSLN